MTNTELYGIISVITSKAIELRSAMEEAMDEIYLIEDETTETSNLYDMLDDELSSVNRVEDYTFQMKEYYDEKETFKGFEEE